MTEEENTRKKYGDIIDKERPENPDVFARHPRMPLSERAKIFAPFEALRGHKERLREEEENSAGELAGSKDPWHDDRDSTEC